MHRHINLLVPYVTGAQLHRPVCCFRIITKGNAANHWGNVVERGIALSLYLVLVTYLIECISR